MDCYTKQRCSGCQPNTCQNAPQGPGPVIRPGYPMGPGPVIRPAAAAGECIDQYPVAMAYVPCQRWQQVYPIEQAICRGTIFPDLDKPFVMGRCR